MNISRTTHLLCALLASAFVASASRAAPPVVRGDVVAIDPTKNELRVEGRGLTRGTVFTFTLDDKTLVLFGSQKGAAVDVQAGRHVRVEFEEDGQGQRIARVVHVSGRLSNPPAAKAETVPAPPAVSGDAVTGVLQRVARADREVVVIGPGPGGSETETTIAVPESAKIVKEGKPVVLDSLKEGDTVAIRVERRDGRSSALEVQAGPGAALSTGSAKERNQTVPRLRQALHLADEILKRIDTGDPTPPKP